MPPRDTDSSTVLAVGSPAALDPALHEAAVREDDRLSRLMNRPIVAAPVEESLP